MVDFPKTLPVKDLLAYNPEAQKDYTEILQDYYIGGEQFDKRSKDKEIVRRAMEEKNIAAGCMNGTDHYTQRRKRAQYINRAGGVIGWIVANVTKDGPRLEVEGGTEEQQKRYLSLNDDSDGEGTPFSSVVAQLMEDELTSRRAYVEAKSVDGEQVNLDRLNSLSVLDWQKGEWVKSHFVGYIRPAEKPYGCADIKEHCWYFYTPTDTIVYKALEDDNGFINPDGTQSTCDYAEAVRDDELSIYGHSFGTIPIFDVRATRSHWVMDRIREPLKALFNAEIDLSFALAQSAYEQPVITVQDPKRADKIIRDDASVFVLIEGEKYELVGPSGKGLDGLFKNVERLKLALFESMQMMAKEAMSLPQAGRLSGEAVREMRTPMEALMLSLTWPVKDALYRSIEAVKEFYNDDVTVKIVNFGISDEPKEAELRQVIMGEDDNGSGNQSGSDDNGDYEEGQEAQE